MLLRVEDELADRGSVVATLQLLDTLTGVGAEYFDDVAACRRSSNQGTHRVASDRRQFDVVCLNTERNALVCDEVEKLERAYRLTGQADDFGGRLLGGGHRAQACRVVEGFELLDQLKRDEVEDEGALCQTADDYFLPKFDAVDELVMVERDLGAALTFVAIPDDQLVALLREDKHDDVRSVMHLDQGH